MKTRQLGPKGPTVSAIGLGCMGMSEGYGVADEGEAVATLRRALELGCTFLDTADIYGPHVNEELVGRCIRGRRNEVFLATKFGFETDPERAKTRNLDGRPGNVPAKCDASLQRLGVDVIDLYYLHRVDPAVPIEETVGAMAKLVSAGKVRYLGLSEVGPENLERAHAVHPITALQSEYSLWTRDPEESGAFATCNALGIALVPFSPLGRGFLTGALRSPDDFEPDDFRRKNPRFQGENFARNLRLVDELKRLAQVKGCTPAQLALAWVLTRGKHVVPIPGTKRRDRLEENLGALEIELSAAELGAIDAIFPAEAVSGPRYNEAMMAMVAK